VKRAAYLLLFALLALSPFARAEGKFSTPLAAAPALPPAAQEVDIEEQLGRRLDGDLEFSDMDGRRVRLGDSFRGDKPVILVLAYFRCPMLCGLVLRGVVKGLESLQYQLGKEYRALTVSFDPRDTPKAAREKRESALGALGLRVSDPAAWPFLVGPERASRALAEQIGYRFAYDPRTDQYAHPAAAIVLTPDGRISRYLYGIEYSPRDLRLALVEAGEGKIGTILDRLILTCYHYDPATRAYGPFVVGFMRIGGVFIAVSVLALLVAMARGERRRRAHPAANGGSP
jgi:protein SCO1/2